MYHTDSNLHKVMNFMAQASTICLLNDSFPPLIDGVANAVVNYARVLQGNGQNPVVITPSHPDSRDQVFSFPVIRYPSLDLRKMTGYMAGVPFSPSAAQQLEKMQPAILHSHCPVMSTLLARQLRQIVDAPLVLTYHTKFDIDIANIMKSRLLQEGSKKALLENINACDEVWAVSQGAAENLRALGYEGECIVMPNGVDLPRGQVGAEAIAEATKDFDLPSGIPVFLFVGRMMWYKGLKITLDALAMLRKAGDPFRMVFIGSGADLEEVKQYAEKCGISQCCIFTGPIRDREILRAWYCRADLFLFPSTFDTNGLVVREAAACSLGSVLIRGSCAAEGISDGRNGLLIEESPESMFNCLHAILQHPQAMAAIGETACREIYMSWEDAVNCAAERYEIVIDRYRSGACPGHYRAMDGVLRVNGELMENLGHIQMHREALYTTIHEDLEERKSAIRDGIHEEREMLHSQFLEERESIRKSVLEEREILRERIHDVLKNMSTDQD